MSDPNYTPTTWVDDGPPPISASNLNHAENGILSAHERITAIGGGKLVLKTLAEFAAIVSPANGDEYAVLVDASVGIVWHVKYRSASANADKWEVIGGGPPLAAQVLTSEASPGTSYGDPATAGPSITVPRPGFYRAQGIFEMNESNFGRNVRGAIKVGAAAASDNDSAGGGVVDGSGNQGGIGTMTCSAEFTAAASDVIKLVYKNGTGGTVAVSRRKLKLWPVRIS